MSIPIKTILNNPSARPNTPVSNRSGSEASSPASDANVPSILRSTHVRNKKSRDSSDLTYTYPTGVIKYGAYEDSTDEVSMELMRPFNIYPLGTITQWCAHIPYSSDKKDLKLKTGREKLEVFVYRFTDPNDKQTYDVMWDYRSGHVRISPFFKNRKHKKTGPAKMLEANPGMRDVTTQITGGNRIAQGYWVHMLCARAACATFCYHIRGALIPIFGPDFPRDCVRPDQQGFNCMAIDPRIIQDAKREANAHLITNRPLATITSHPQRMVEDQYAGSPMHQYTMRQSILSGHCTPKGAYGPSLPYYDVPEPTYPRTIDHRDMRPMSEDLCRVSPRKTPTPVDMRPLSSSSDFFETHSGYEGMSHPRPVLPPLVTWPNTMTPMTTFPRISKRKSPSMDYETKRQKTTAECNGLVETAQAWPVLEDRPLTTAPVDPQLEEATELHVVNEPASSPSSYLPPAEDEPRHGAEDYEVAAILIIMSRGGF